MNNTEKIDNEKVIKRVPKRQSRNSESENLENKNQKNWNAEDQDNFIENKENEDHDLT